ncbi:lytic transglycosylase domain-containing protein [Alteribacter aurantiacus]|uniref:lytic transglycosylase domain-containing protein n=1 Tax=Alteribacter aurantiacus TaxID=254410 RepID=UPI00040942BF|nr:lytic transglycosylase domain-containing protein [Alteribacter aurantiacus]
MAKRKSKTKRVPHSLKVLSVFGLIVLLVVGIVQTIDWDEDRWGAPLSERGEMEVPDDYLPIYKAAEDEYGVPWNLLAAVHRVETIFSTMDPLVSPVGAEGHMQFMPCTWTGWSHPTCGGLGEGDIPNEEKTDPEIIQQYGGYGVDATGNGVADPYNIEDAVFSAAKYLAANGAADGEYERAVFAYNRADWYVEDVIGFADRYVEEKEEEE